MVHTNTRNKASLKMFNELSSFLFEQEYGELERLSRADKEALQKALDILGKLIK